MPDDAVEALRARSRANLGEKLLRAARLYNQHAIANMQRRGHPLREAHTRLFPHFDLEGTRLTDLAARAGITKQSAQQLVDELVDAGYVAREPDPADGRAKRLVITRPGRRGFEDGLRSLASVQAELTAEVGERRMKAFERALDAMLVALED